MFFFDTSNKFETEFNIKYFTNITQFVSKHIIALFLLCPGDWKLANIERMDTMIPS